MVLLAIANHASHRGDDAWPSHPTIAVMCRVSRRTVIRSVEKLVALGELSVEPRSGPAVVGRTKQRPNVYSFPVYQASAGHEASQQDATASYPQAARKTCQPVTSSAGEAPKDVTTTTERRDNHNGRRDNHDMKDVTLLSHKPSFDPSLDPSSNPRAPRSETAAVIDALRERTGKTVDANHAGLVIRQLLSGRDGVKNRVAYLAGVIRKDPEPQRLLPTPSPPRYRAECGV
jgi:hypothetical protein